MSKHVLMGQTLQNMRGHLAFAPGHLAWENACRKREGWLLSQATGHHIDFDNSCVFDKGSFRNKKKKKKNFRGLAHLCTKNAVTDKKLCVT